MLKGSKNGVSTNVRLGVPTQRGFSGLVVEVEVAPLVILLGGVIAVSVVWLALRVKPPKPADAVDTPTQIAVARGA